MWVSNITLLFLLFLSFFQIPLIIQTSQQVLQTFLTSLFPSLFFMLLLCKLLLRSGLIQRCMKLYKPLDHSVYLYALLGMILGFAGNAVLLKEAYMKDELTTQEVQIITLCCCIPSSSFCIFTLGDLLGDLRYGIFLFAIQCIFTLLVLSFYTPISQIGYTENTALDLAEAIQSSGNSLYMMLGYILLVNVTLALLAPLLPNTLQKILFYIGEFASASIQTASSNNTLTTKLYALAMILGFGSINAHLQIYAITPQPPKYSRFLVYRILQMIFSISITFLFFKFLN